MTCYVLQRDMPTKKALRHMIADGRDCMICDPSVVKPFKGLLSEYVDANGVCYLTNHPKRSWFAAVRRRKDGKLQVE